MGNTIPENMAEAEKRLEELRRSDDKGSRGGLRGLGLVVDDAT